MQIKTLPNKVKAYGEKMLTDSRQFSSQPIDFDTAYYLAGKLSEIKVLLEGLKENVVYNVFERMHHEKPTKDLNWLTQIERVLIACFRGAGIEASLVSNELGKFQEVLRSAMRARNNPFGWLRWKIFSKEKTFLKRVMVANELKSNRRGFNILVDRIDNRLNFEHALSEIKKNSWLHNFPEGYRKIDLQDWFYWQKMGLNMYAIAQNIRSFSEYLNPVKFEHQHYMSNLFGLFELIRQVPNQLIEWQHYLNIHQVRSIILEKEDLQRLEKILMKDFDAICDYHKLLKTLNTEERKVLDETTDITTQTEEAITVFLNSLSLAWIDHIESKYPNLRDVFIG